MAQEDDRRKHLEMLQAVIARQTNYGFSVKILAVLLTACFALLAPKQERAMMSLILLALLLILWSLDAYFLYHISRFQKLFKRASQNRTPVYRMEPHPDMDHVGLGISYLLKPTIWPIYLVLAATLFFMAQFPFSAFIDFQKTPIVKASPKAK